MTNMAVKLLVSKSRVAHVEGCVRLRNAAHPSQVEPWDGLGEIKPCRTCLYGHSYAPHGRRKRPLPCTICGHLQARPCPHNGVMRTVTRTGHRAGSTATQWTFPDLAIEKDWLLSLLDS